MDQKKLRHYADIFKALGHPTRLAIMLGLSKQECNVSNIVEKLGVSQSTVSQHLAILRRTGIVEYEKKGLEVCYRIEHEIMQEIMKIIHKENICSDS